MAQQNSLSTLGERIDAARKRRNMTWYRVAKDAHMDYSQLYRSVRGTHPTRDSLLRICRALNSSPQEAAEIFAATDYRAPDAEELEEERVSAA